MFLLSAFSSFSQISILPVPPACAGETIQLSAVVTGVYGTESYTFEQFPYTPETYDGGTPVIMGDDAVYPAGISALGIPIGFPFCFLNNSVDYFWIGSNGWISFLPNQSTEFVASTIPNPVAPQKAIFAPWQDWDPSVGAQHTEGYIFYKYAGVAPDRKVIIYWKDCPLFQCNDSTGRFQIVLHETTNIIDNHISLKSTCMTWPAPPNEPNRATQGIQSSPDPITSNIPYYIAFDRNQTSWHVWHGEEESTHFIPSGITWHEGTPTGPVVGNGDKIFVTATVSTTYWAVLAACDNTGNYQASVNVIVYPLPNPTISGPATACQNDIKTYTTQGGNNHYTYVINGGFSFAGGGANDPWIDVKWTNPGLRSISVTYTTPDNCNAVNPASQDVTVNAYESPVITTTADEFCMETDVTFTCQAGKANYDWVYPVAGVINLIGGTLTDNFITIRWNTPGPKTVTVNYTDAGCTGDPPASKQVTIKPTPVLSGTLTKSICSGANTNITLVSSPPGASFSWIIPPPICSANISSPCPTGSASGTQISDVISLNNSVPGTVRYFVAPTLNGCTSSPEEYMVNINPLPSAIITGDVTVCQNAGAPMITFFGSSGTPPYTFTYHINSGPDQTITTTSGNSISLPAPTGSVGLFTYYLTNVFDGSQTTCSQPLAASVNVTVKNLPTSTISGSTTLCQNSGSPLVVFAGFNGTTPYTFTYKINNGPDQVITTSIGNSVSLPVSTASSGTFTYTLVSVREGSPEVCSQVQAGSAIIIINPLPLPAISGPDIVCKNTIHEYSTAQGMSNYQWSVDPLYGTITPVPGAPYSVSVTWISTGTTHLLVNYTDQNNCTASTPSSYQVVVQDLPSPSITGSQNVCEGTTVNYLSATAATTYQWVIPVSGGTYTGGGQSDDHLTMTWVNPGTYIIQLNQTIGNNGCTSLQPASLPVTVRANPSPTIHQTVPGAVCGLSTYNYTTQATGNTYQWTITGGTNQTLGNSSSIDVLWGNTPPVSVDLLETIDYPGQLSCSFPALTLLVTLKPFPSQPNPIVGPGSVCKPTSEQYSVDMVQYATTHQWAYSGLGATITGSGNSTITIDFSASATSGVLTVTGINDCGSGPVSPPRFITVNPKPEVNYSFCNDPITTLTAKKFILRGGSPLLQGIPSQEGYSTNNGSMGNNPIEFLGGNYYFNPALLATTETGVYPVTYKYTNQYACSASSAPHSITVVDPGSIFTGCPGILTDPRIPPPNTYHTIWIGSHCWIQENLHYGSTIAFTTPQTDNCIIERYCLPTDNANCTNYGGFYQWDELVTHDQSLTPLKGICPPGWHIPTSIEWQDLIDACQGDGIASGNLQNGTFSGIMNGIFYLNNLLSFSGGNPGATMFWTSTLSGNKPIARGINAVSPSVSMYESSKANAFPIRCVKD